MKQVLYSYGIIRYSDLRPRRHTALWVGLVSLAILMTFFFLFRFFHHPSVTESPTDTSKLILPVHTLVHYN
jgi:hypothetical protein